MLTRCKNVSHIATLRQELNPGFELWKLVWPRTSVLQWHLIIRSVRIFLKI